MKKTHHLFGLLLVVTFVAYGCSGGAKTEKLVVLSNKDSIAYEWVKYMDSAQWKKTYNYQMMAIRDTLWLLHPDGFWFSTDGRSWQKSSLTDVVDNQAFLDYIEFKGAVYGLGRFSGNIERYNFSTAIHSTTDFSKWSITANQSQLPERFFYHPFVFKDKIWIIGGEDKNGSYSDIWSSDDAIQWVKEGENLPFGKRSGSQVVSFKNKLYLLDSDVLVSDDALHWQQLIPEILPGQQLFGYKALVYDDKIWLLGCNRNGLFSNQVLYSEDGKTWKTQDAPWLPRGGVAAAFFKGKLFMTGGKYGGTPDHTEFRYDNDLWVMERTIGKK